MPSRWTFATGILPFAHCVSAALRHPGFACSHSPLEGTGNPSLVTVTHAGRCDRASETQQEAPSGSEGIQAGSTIRLQSRTQTVKADRP
jgi:hypothetical protein